MSERRKERSAVEVVTGNVRYNFNSLSTSWSIPLYIELSFITLAMVLTLVTIFIPKELVLIASGSIDSWVFNLSSAKSFFKYISKSGEILFSVLPLAKSIKIDSISFTMARSFSINLHLQLVQLLQNTCGNVSLLQFRMCGN